MTFLVTADSVPSDPFENRLWPLSPQSSKKKRKCLVTRSQPILIWMNIFRLILVPKMKSTLEIRMFQVQDTTTSPRLEVLHVLCLFPGWNNGINYSECRFKITRKNPNERLVQIVNGKSTMKSMKRLKSMFLFRNGLGTNQPLRARICVWPIPRWMLIA